MINKQRVVWTQLEHYGNYKAVPFEDINATYIDKLITSTAQIVGIQPPQVQLDNVRYICEECKEPVYPDRVLARHELPKYKCDWCNHTGLFEVKRNYKDAQQLIIGSKNTKKQIILYLEDKLSSFDKYLMYDTIQFKGFVQLADETKNNSQLIIQCREITILSRMEETEPTAVTEINRESPEYRQWVTDIQNRDKVCQICGGTKHLEAHHIYGYKNNPELRTDRGNGVLLCTFCHGKFHSYYGKDVTPADLVKFIFEFKGL